MNDINKEVILACVFFMMSELLIVLGMIGRVPELFLLAGLYAFPIWICYISAKHKFDKL